MAPLEPDELLLWWLLWLLWLLWLEWLLREGGSELADNDDDVEEEGSVDEVVPGSAVDLALSPWPEFPDRRSLVEDEDDTPPEEDRPAVLQLVEPESARDSDPECPLPLPVELGCVATVIAPLPRAEADEEPDAEEEDGRLSGLGIASGCCGRPGTRF